MSAVIQKNSLFYDGFTQNLGGGVDYLNGNYNDRIKRITEVWFSWNLKDANLLFDSATKTIVMQNQYDNRTFTAQEFKNKDSITIVNSRYNDGDYTITEISDDGKTITVAESVTDESADGDLISVHGITPITQLNLFYNLVPNNTGEDYSSVVDPFSKQKFTVDNLDANNSTAKPMAVGTKSFAWVTEKITDTVNGKTNAVYVKGYGFDDYVQKFQVTQYFTITPFFLNSQIYNFENIVPPDYYYAGNSLKYVCRIEAMYLAGTPVADHVAIDTGKNGTGSWLNQAALGARGEYSITEIVYTDNDTLASIDRLDISRNCKVVVTVNSRSGKFVAGGSDVDGTQFILGFNACVTDESEYQNTPTTQRDNFYQDSCTNFLGSASANGLQYGTTRQSITACIGRYIDANTMEIIFVFVAGSALVAFWEGKENGDRNYEINLITQDVAITATAPTDRMTLLCDYQSADWNRKDTTLFAFTGTGLRAYKYPDLGLFARGSLEGFQGEAFFVDLAFKIKQQLGTTDVCTVQNLKWQVVTTKVGQDGFVLEERIINFSTAKKLLAIQQLEFLDTRGFISYDGDPCNIVSVIRDAANDTGTESAWLAYYGLILRYENWVDALNQYYTGDNALSEVAKFIDEITQDWKTYNNNQGWNLKLRFSIEILNTVTNSTNIYQTQIPIVVKTDDQVVWAGSTAPHGVTQTTQYFNEAETEEIFSIDRNGITKIRTTLSGTSPLEDDEQYFGMMAATIQGGTIFDRRIASSEIASEEDSPFTPTDADPAANFSWANGNCRINIFEGYTGVTTITLESYFDSKIYSQIKSNLVIQSVIGATPITNSGS